MDRDNIFSQIEYLLIRLLLIALLLIGGYKLLEREIHAASANKEVSTAVALCKLNSQPTEWPG